MRFQANGIVLQHGWEFMKIGADCDLWIEGEKEKGTWREWERGRWERKGRSKEQRGLQRERERDPCRVEWIQTPTQTIAFLCPTNCNSQISNSNSSNLNSQQQFIHSYLWLWDGKRRRAHRDRQCVLAI